MLPRPAALVVLTLVALAAAGVAGCGRDAPPPDEPPAVEDGPPPTADSPFRNTRPGVAYVGDAKCAECHAEIAAAYRSHPMARSLFPAGADDAPPGEFDALGFHFAAAADGGKPVHRYDKRDAQGRPVAPAELPVGYALGSGTRGKSYLVERDGRLIQSPASWFTQAHKWDLSPGFANVLPGERVVSAPCLFCHANAVDPVPHSRNAYRAPVFRGHGIGCERCHGPGELHAAAPNDRDPAGGFDRTIVNPKHLAPNLREAVCQQCHLQGERRFERRGRETFDYRPGLPLEDYWAVFVWGTGPGGGAKAVGHVEQMQASKCYTATGGALGCSSCHDPHRVPAEKDKAAYYRGRCQTCHETRAPCTAPAAERQAKADSCVACHMPRYGSADIAHTAVTNHRVPRRPAADAPPPREDAPTLVSFFQGRRPNDPDADRDVGLALVHADPRPGPQRTALAEMSRPLLEAAFARRPSDVPAGEGLGWALACLDRPGEALDAYQRVLERAPGREQTLILAAQAAEGVGRFDDALGYRLRLTALNPYLGEYHADAAKLLARKQDWPAVVREAEAALRLTPADRDARLILVAALARQGDRPRAAAELETLIRLSPADEAELRKFFTRLK
ncbi:MAG: hypothetical protein K2X87_15700 [Gemmataceae bacterium]|nr:hypothetical protein [Gemmataceae bacterium]